MPPTIGAAIRFDRSDPVPVVHMIGISPTSIVGTVMNFGRSRSRPGTTIAALQIDERAQASVARRLRVR
jgi:hypothetical protein